MLRIYPVCLPLVRDARALADRIAKHDRDQARQLRRSSVSVVLNVAESSGARDEPALLDRGARAAKRPRFAARWPSMLVRRPREPAAARVGASSQSKD